MFTWHEYHNAAASAQAQADFVAGALQNALDEKGSAVLAVSGGRSPVAFFEVLSQQDLDWKNISVGLADERIVPTTNDDSNTGLVRAYLLQNKAAEASWVPMVEDGRSETELQPESVVTFALKQYKQPDVLVLGMGADGHTASLFPQAPQLADGIDLGNPAPLLHTTPVTAPHERVSMTLSAIAATPTVVLAIGGAEKKAVFERAAAKVDTAYPISLILNHEGVGCHVFYAE